MLMPSTHMVPIKPYHFLALKRIYCGHFVKHIIVALECSHVSKTTYAFISNHINNPFSSDGLDFWGAIFDNGSSDGAVSDIYEQRSEVMIGCLYNWYPEIWEISQFIAKSAVTVLGPGPT